MTVFFFFFFLLQYNKWKYSSKKAINPQLLNWNAWLPIQESLYSLFFWAVGRNGRWKTLSKTSGLVLKANAFFPLSDVKAKHSHINHKSVSPGGDGAGGCGEKLRSLAMCLVWKLLSVWGRICVELSYWTSQDVFGGSRVCYASWYESMFAFLGKTSAGCFFPDVSIKAADFSAVGRKIRKTN